jgi:hypothetical protein
MVLVEMMFVVRRFVEKLFVPQLVKKLPVLYGTVSTRTRLSAESGQTLAPRVVITTLCVSKCICIQNAAAHVLRSTDEI